MAPGFALRGSNFAAGIPWWHDELANVGWTNENCTPTVAATPTTGAELEPAAACAELRPGIYGTNRGGVGHLVSVRTGP